MHPVLRLVRIGNVGVSFAGTLVGGAVAAGVGAFATGSFALALGLAALSTAAVTAGGNVLNDLLDIETDRTNHPDRPLVRGDLRPSTARALAVGLFVVGVGSVAVYLPARPLVGAILAAAIVALLGYESLFKARGAVGNAVVAFLTAMVFLYGGAMAGAPLLVVPFALMAFLATFSREVIKDMEDAKGDVDRSTIPRTYGLATASVLAQGSVGAAVAISFAPLLWFVPLASVAGIMYLALVLAADAAFVTSVIHLPGRLHAEQTRSKLAMTIALLAFFAVAFR